MFQRVQIWCHYGARVESQTHMVWVLELDSLVVLYLDPLGTLNQPPSA